MSTRETQIRRALQNIASGKHAVSPHLMAELVRDGYLEHRGSYIPFGDHVKTHYELTEKGLAVLASK